MVRKGARMGYRITSGGAVLAAALALGACTAAPPDRPAGVGFGDYEAYLTQREAALAGTAPIPPAISPPGAAPVAAAPPATGAPLNPMGAALPPPLATATAPVAPPVEVRPLAAPAAPSAAPGAATISDEQNFEAVAARESIQSDAERLAANRAAYVQVPTTALPERAGAAGPNLAAYALAAPNRLGEPVYNRIGLKFVNHDRACGKYASADLAQTAFLENGGPGRDMGNLDPDGDGFACSWDPTPFQAVRATP